MLKGTIYIIKNKINKKVYIGQTTMSVTDRWMAHKKPSTSKRKSTYKLYNAINKYGVENFYIETLVNNIELTELDSKEIYYIKVYDSYNNGYNSTKGGDGRIFNNEYDIESIINDYRNGESTIKIALKHNVSRTTISRVLHANNIKTRKDGCKLEDSMKDELICLASNKTYKEIATIYKVDERTIRRFLKKHSFSKRKLSKAKQLSFME